MHVRVYVRCAQVKSLSFECHTDADGIMRCIRMCRCVCVCVCVCVGALS